MIWILLMRSDLYRTLNSHEYHIREIFEQQLQQMSSLKLLGCEFATSQRILLLLNSGRSIFKLQVKFCWHFFNGRFKNIIYQQNHSKIYPYHILTLQNLETTIILKLLWPRKKKSEELTIHAWLNCIFFFAMYLSN